MWREYRWVQCDGFSSRTPLGGSSVTLKANANKAYKGRLTASVLSVGLKRPTFQTAVRRRPSRWRWSDWTTATPPVCRCTASRSSHRNWPRSRSRLLRSPWPTWALLHSQCYDYIAHARCSHSNYNDFNHLLCVKLNRKLTLPFEKLKLIDLWKVFKLLSRGKCLFSTKTVTKEHAQKERSLTTSFNVDSMTFTTFDLIGKSSFALWNWMGFPSV